VHHLTPFKRTSCLPGGMGPNMLGSMATSAPEQVKGPAGPLKLKQLAAKIAALVVLGLLLGFFQDWAAPRFYRPDREAGFHLGMLQGALMPAALPALLMGKDVPIYAPANVGRLYKIGYILGINICGTVFFGVGMWRSRRQST
jgi:hypothetical protein